MTSAGEDQHPTPLETGTPLDAIVIGAGLAGRYLLIDCANSACRCGHRQHLVLESLPWRAAI